VENLVTPSVVRASEIGALPNGRASASALHAGETPAVPVCTRPLPQAVLTTALDAGETPAVPVCTRPLPQAVLTTALGAGGNNAIPVLAPAVPGAGETPAVPVKEVVNKHRGECSGN